VRWTRTDYSKWVRKSVILAAGRGKRMGSLTDDRPKPMLLLHGKPLLEHVLDDLRGAGLDEALIVVGYKAEMIQEHFARYPMKISYVHQTEINGTARAALLAREFAGGENFLLTFGDIMMPTEEYRGIVRLLEESQADAVLGVKRVEDPWQGAAVYEESGRVTRIIEKPPPGTSTTHWNSAGLYTFTPALFPELERVQPSSRGEYELTSAIGQLIESGRNVRLYAIEGEWRDVGRPEDLAAMREKGPV
jgi:UDP-N-acetylglucosamine diphosphorylase / glucose-1-phosphate thymidylyltransferase / UDP-N-acetylgalactosamine diphosphorylase / glucosamine-1-phosphate N-acetyltransferase / galactosamine-1-phosphate N-acetyltransferase